MSLSVDALGDFQDVRLLEPSSAGQQSTRRRERTKKACVACKPLLDDGKSSEQLLPCS